MIQDIQNHMRYQALSQDFYTAPPKLGSVLNVDTQTYTAQILLQPEGQITPFLPIFSCWAGNGWGQFSPPSPGDQALVLFQEADKNNGIVLLFGYNDVNQSLNVPQGEYWLVHASGSFIKLKNNGNIDIHASATVGQTAPSISITGTSSVTVSSPEVKIESSGSILIDANSSIGINAPTVNAGAGGAVSKLVKESFEALFNSHTHDTPSGESSSPTQQMGSSELTSNFGAN